MTPKTTEEFYRKYENSLKEPIVREFLKEDENRILLEKYLKNDSEVIKNKIDFKFRNLFLKAKIFKYMSNLIKFYSIDYDKRIRKIQERYPLVVDSQEDDDRHFLESVEQSLYSTNPELEKKVSLIDHIEDEDLKAAVDSLTTKQKKVLELKYLHVLPNKEIAERFDESPQNISNIHRSALKKVQNKLRKGSC